MAVRKRLIALLAVAVLIAHTAAIDWLASQWQPVVLKPLPKPMYTRQIVQTAPETRNSEQNVATALVQRSAPAITSIAKEGADAAPKKRAPKPKPAASEVTRTAQSEAAPAPAEPDVSEPPQPPALAASAPAPAASEPALPSTAAPEAPALTTDPPDAEPLPGWPSDTRLSYELSGYYLGELHGSAQVLWQREGNDYQAVIEIDLGLLANLKLTSQGRITAHGLAPRMYEELQRSRRRQVRLEDSIIVLNDGKRVDRPPGVQDTASQFVELAHRFQTGQVPLEPGRTISLMLARPGGAASWTYDVVGVEMLPTPTLGAVEAWHLKPRPLAQPGGNISAEIWFAPTLQYLPVRIRVSMKDEAWVDLVVKRIDQK